MHPAPGVLAWIQFVGPNRALELFGVKLVGINAESGRKLLFSIAFVIVMMLINAVAHRLARWIAGKRGERVAFWSRQIIRLATGLVLIVGLLSIWFDDPVRLATAMGLVTAGLAFALQRVITALAGYMVILRGKTFNVGDRISMGGVRGDVIALGFIQTTIMEMGQPPAVQNADPAMWVKSRQYTGRIVTVTNDKVFQEPIYNYTQEFPWIWEELAIPIAYKADRHRAEQILLHVTGRQTEDMARIGEAEIREIERRYVVARSEFAPRVYWRLTDNWLEMSIRFIAKAHGVRELKDSISRDILNAFDEAGIGLASATFELVGIPPLQLTRPHRPPRPPEPPDPPPDL